MKCRANGAILTSTARKPCAESVLISTEKCPNVERRSGPLSRYQRLEGWRSAIGPGPTVTIGIMAREAVGHQTVSFSYFFIIRY